MPPPPSFISWPHPLPQHADLLVGERTGEGPDLVDGPVQVLAPPVAVGQRLVAADAGVTSTQRTSATP
ncbi:hypothetical protein OG497_21220 [Streptomyces sp. NBC_01242]|uniref:hypothetical protein n=1 Tax=Streptomyces sp. NBC_01242 TaxID=2903795 RepID=UPI00224D3F1F|nr:hypothetical protein [Streptomyces sp. NBC_01242]MCX4796544.1 hypothetical protein [Streptomyces sp. NBC_01242]